jgi:uncharacterized membrane protein YiaA
MHFMFTQDKQVNPAQIMNKSTLAYRGAALAALLIGAVSYGIGLFNAEMLLNEKGYYLTIMLFGLYASVSAQKAIRDRDDGIPTSQIFLTISFVAIASAISLLCIGLYNAELLLSEKGFFGMAYTLSLFAAITVQKTVRDDIAFESNSTASQASDKCDAKAAEPTQTKAESVHRRDNNSWVEA